MRARSCSNRGSRRRARRRTARRWASIGSSRWSRRRARPMAQRTEPLVWLRAAIGGAATSFAALDAVPEAGQFNLLASRDRGAEAMRIAAEMPERVLALVLESPRCEPDPRVTVPTLVVAGTEDECTVGPAFRAQLPNCHY